MSFRIGDVVTLISGSPRMTVIALDGDLVRCAFFRLGEDHIFEAPVHALEHIEDRETQQIKNWISAFSRLTRRA